MDKILKDILKNTRKDALQVLRDNFGFDYNKPIKTVEIIVPFTAKSLKKVGVDVNTMVIVILFRFTFNNSVRFKIAEFTNGEVNLVNYIYPFSAVSTKSEFNDLRKGELYCETYVIAQNKNDVLPCRTGCLFPAVKECDINERFVPCGSSFRAVKFNSSRKQSYTCQYEEFDKSGYPVVKKQELLRSKCELLKRDREKNAYKAMNNTGDMICKAKQAIEAKRIELYDRFLNAKTHLEINELSYSLSRLSNSLQEIEYVERKDAEKSFSSPQAFYNSIKYIYELLERA